MKIYFELENIDREIEATSVALGTFDGLHIGHIEIINHMKSVAEEKGLKSFVRIVKVMYFSRFISFPPSFACFFITLLYSRLYFFKSSQGSFDAG